MCVVDPRADPAGQQPGRPLHHHRRIKPGPGDQGVDVRQPLQVLLSLLHRSRTGSVFIRDLYLKLPPKARDFVSLRLMQQKPPEIETSVSPELRKELEERLRHDVRALRTFIDGDFDGWGIAAEG